MWLVIFLVVAVVVLGLSLALAVVERFIKETISNSCPSKMTRLKPVNSANFLSHSGYYCMASYYWSCHPEDTSWVPPGWTLHNLRGRGFILTSDSTAVVVFRGTFSVPDVLIDFTSHQVSAQPLGMAGRVHAGYLQTYLGMREIVQKLTKARDVYITGHSMGAALAVLAAVDVPHSHVVCLAPPKVGDALFVTAAPTKLRNSDIHVVINNADVIPISPAGVFGPFFHLGENFQTRFTHDRGKWALNHSLNVYIKSLVDKAG